MAEKEYRQARFRRPAGATEILLVRHGESEPLVPGRPFPLVDGHGDPALAPEGHEQAKRVAARLATQRIAAIYVTTLRRTAQTAAPLAAELGLTPTVEPDLREVHLGEWEGGEYRIRAARRDPLVRQMFREERWDVIPGAEPMDALAERVRAGVEAILAAVGPGGQAIAFLHAGIIGEVCRQATGGRPFAFVHADNASVSRLVVFANGRWMLHSFNDTAHLRADGAERD
jgi:2,3-bisphosphoglycerate-dependent phosphoglycerate mutase